jgi:hypothetical protein
MSSLGNLTLLADGTSRMELNNDWVGSLTVFESATVVPTISNEVNLTSISDVSLKYIRTNDIIKGCIKATITATAATAFSFRATTPTSTGARLGFGGGYRVADPADLADVVVNGTITCDALGNTTNAADMVWVFDFTYAIF